MQLRLSDLNFFRNYSSFKEDQLQILQMVQLKTTVISKISLSRLSTLIYTSGSGSDWGKDSGSGLRSSGSGRVEF